LPILDARKKKREEEKKAKKADERVLKETDESMVDSLFDPSENETGDNQYKGKPK
jgi:hypothetical protein